MVRAAAVAAALVLVAACLVGPAGGAGDSSAGVGDSVPAPADAPQQLQAAPESPSDGAIADCAAAPPADHEPPAEDAVGWVGGYWYNETIPVDQSDGLSEDELDALVARTQARVEAIRCLEFENETSVTVQPRAEFEAELGNWTAGDDRRAFENAVYRGLFLVGDDEDALEVQRENLGAGVAGYYEPATERIVVVSDDDEALRFDETVLAHELVHALQDQHFDLARFDDETIDGSNAEEGLVEGDATLVERRYERACEDGAWTDGCFEVDDDGADAEQPTLANEGLYLLAYQPYSDGPAFARERYRDGGWAAVDAVYEAPPETAAQVMYPDRYPREGPANVTVDDRSGERWERLRVDGRPDHAVVGEPGLFAMFAYPTYHSEFDETIVAPEEFINVGPDGEPDPFDPYDYTHEHTSGWDGDRLVPYRDAAGETGYVWTIAWTNEDEARSFVHGYGDLLEYWGADPVEDRANTYTVDGAFSGAYYLDRDHDRVTIVHAPSVDALRELDSDAAPAVDRTHPGLPDYDDPTAAEEREESDSIPGFGPIAALLGAVCALAGLRRRTA